MSMLAEPRSRQKWSEDPRNTRWSSDKSKFGYQMLTKMGWSEGLGLGSTLQGDTSHVKIKKKKNGHGIGMKSSHDDDWIAHQDSFNALLSSLNSGDAPSDKKIQSLEDRVRVTRTKIMYSRFVKSKDLSRASNNDLACIFGQRSKSAPSTPQRSEDEDESLSDGSTASCPTEKRQKSALKTTTEHGFTTISSGVSVADYFASKMAALKQGSKTSLTSTVASVPDDDSKGSEETEIEKPKKKKKKKHKNVTFDITENSSADESGESKKASEEEECTSEKKSKKKKHKKSQKSDTVEEADEEISQVENVEVKKKKKKKKARLEEGADGQQIVVCEKKEKSKDRVEERSTNKSSHSDEHASSSSNSESPQSVPVKPSKKSKKKKNKDAENDIVENESESTTKDNDDTVTSSSSSSKKSKKKKRRHEEMMNNEDSNENESEVVVVEERKKKRKKRHQSDGEEDGAN